MVVHQDIRDVWDILKTVEDTEIPVISVVDLGIVRDVRMDSDLCIVEITPTYSGCPATKVIEDSIRQALISAGIEDFRIETTLSPPWSTAMLSNDGREKLREYGIAPPEDEETDKLALMGEDRQVSCPQCGSKDTKMVSQFGSTPCKAHFQCKECLEPFDYFKCL